MNVLKTILATGLLLAGSLVAAHAEYPDRPITLIVPWGAGGGTDATGRILANLMEKQLGQPINVVNRTGGGSVIGHTEIAQAKPDGYTLGIITTELSMFHWIGTSPLTYQDYTLIGLYNADPSAVVVQASSPYKTMEDLAKAIKEKASALRAGGANQGGLNHLAYVSLVNELGGDRAFWVPTEGAAPALQLLASGAINVAVVQLPEAKGLIDAGELRPLATSWQRAQSRLPGCSDHQGKRGHRLPDRRLARPRRAQGSAGRRHEQAARRHGKVVKSTNSRTSCTSATTAWCGKAALISMPTWHAVTRPSAKR